MDDGADAGKQIGSQRTSQIVWRVAAIRAQGRLTRQRKHRPAGSAGRRAQPLPDIAVRAGYSEQAAWGDHRSIGDLRADASSLSLVSPNRDQVMKCQLALYWIEQALDAL